MDILDDMGVCKLSAQAFFLKKWTNPLRFLQENVICYVVAVQDQGFIQIYSHCD